MFGAGLLTPPSGFAVVEQGLAVVPSTAASEPGRRGQETRAELVLHLGPARSGRVVMMALLLPDRARVRHRADTDRAGWGGRREGLGLGRRRVGQGIVGIDHP